MPLGQNELIESAANQRWRFENCGEDTGIAYTMPCTRGGFGLATASGRGLGRFQAGSPLAQYNLKVCLAENGLRRKGHVAVYPSAHTQIHSHAADFAEAD